MPYSLVERCKSRSRHTDVHENGPLKIFYKNFPGYDKGSVFLNYEINTAGDDNSGRWDYSNPVYAIASFA